MPPKDTVELSQNLDAHLSPHAEQSVTIEWKPGNGGNCLHDDLGGPHTGPGRILRPGEAVARGVGARLTLARTCTRGESIG
jgi:hypothetical protein